MNPEEVGDLFENALMAIYDMSAPMLFVGLIVGVSVSLIQAATQLQEVTLVFIPKMLAVGAVLWIYGPEIYESFDALWGEVILRLRGVSTAP